MSGTVRVDLDRSRRPAVVASWNRISSRFGGAVAGRGLSVSALMDAAERKTGLSDFGADAFIRPVRTLVDSLNASAAFHPFGRALARRMLTELLCNRLYVEHDWKHAPDIHETPIVRPIIIIGLPRTGTSLLFNLLGCDAQHRFLTNWESHRPAPPGGRWSRCRALRRLASVAGLAIQSRIAPQLSMIHETRVDGPDECTGLLLNTFTSQAFAAPFRVPDYLAWLYDCDYAEASRYHRRQLTLIHRQRGGQRWLLKSPNHLPALGALLDTYPEACIIHTHRDPLTVVPSCCSMIAAFRGMFSDRLDGDEIGEEVIAVLTNGLHRSAAARATRDPRQFLDVRYSDLVRDPVSVVRRVYRHFALDLADEAMSRVRQFLAAASRRPRTVHQYSLDQFGLDPVRVRRAFGDYATQLQVSPDEHRGDRHALAER